MNTEANAFGFSFSTITLPRRMRATHAWLNPSNTEDRVRAQQ